MNWRKWGPVIIIVAAGLGAYSNSLTGPFIFDDYNAIVQNEHIRECWPVWDAMAAPPQSTADGRPVVSLSLAFNYALGGLNVWGYHVFNLATHILAALVLFGVVRRTLSGGRLRNRYGAHSRWLALAVAVLWMVHPLLTESVDYVVQRTELLMGSFYLLTLYCVIRGRESRHRQVWFTAAILACALGMGCKEVMVSAPLVVVLYDRTFWSSTFRQAWHERRELYMGLAATWLVLAAALISAPRSETVGIELSGLAPLEYARTQCGVVLHYLRLALWPHPLALDYDDWPIARSWPGALPAVAVVVTGIGATAWMLWRRVPVGFLGAWLILILAPTSSVVPIVTEVVAERRMYLPLIAVVTLLVVGAWSWLEKVGRGGRWGRVTRAAVAGVCAIALAAATARRAQDYRSDLAIWRDTVAKRPNNARAHVNLGSALVAHGQPDEAIAEFRRAAVLKPGYVDALYNLGVALAIQGHSTDARREFALVLARDPKNAKAHGNLGILLAGEGNLEEATKHLAEAIRLNPDYAEAHNSLGSVLAMQGQLDEAKAHFVEAVRLNPGFADAHYNLGLALAHQGKMREALASFEAAVRVDPNFDRARQSRDKLASRLQSQATTITP